MSFIQRFFISIFPKSWGASMEAESRAWKLRCPCGAETSVWEAGGIRWKASGRPRHKLRCAKCGERTWHSCEKGPS